MEFGFRLVNIDKALACISFVLNHPSTLGVASCDQGCGGESKQMSNKYSNYCQKYFI